MKCGIHTYHSLQIACLVRAIYVTHSLLLVPICFMVKFIVGFSYRGGKVGGEECKGVLQLDSELILNEE